MIENYLTLWKMITIISLENVTKHLLIMVSGWIKDNGDQVVEVNTISKMQSHDIPHRFVARIDQITTQKIK